MFQRMADGEIKACWIICTNPVASVANRKTVIEALETAELVITQDVFADTETNAYADVVLPGALWAETEGVLINSERNLTLAQPAVDPPGEALADWRIIARIACEMGYAHAFSYTSAEEIFEEIKRAANPKTGYDLRGVTYERLRDDARSVARRDRRRPGPQPDPLPGRGRRAGVPDGERTGRLLRPPAHSGCRNARRRLPVRPQHRTAPAPVAHPHQDRKGRQAQQAQPGAVRRAASGGRRALGIVEGDSVEIASRRGRAVLPAVVTDRVRPGCCFAPFHWNDLFGEYLSVNAVTSDAVDPISFQPEFKVCAVTLAKVATPVAVAPAPVAAPAEVPAVIVPTAVQPGAASVFGLESTPPPVLAEHERQYLVGFLAGLESGAPGVPVLPPGAPFREEHARWVNGVLAGMYSRAPQTTEESTTQAACQGREVVVLWASQTGNAEEFAAAAADRLTATGHRAALIGMDDTDPEVPPARPPTCC